MVVKYELWLARLVLRDLPSKRYSVHIFILPQMFPQKSLSNPPRFGSCEVRWRWWSLSFSGLLAPNQWRHHLIHLLDVSGQRASEPGKQDINTNLPSYKYLLVSTTLLISHLRAGNNLARQSWVSTPNISKGELFCYSKIQTFLIRPRLEVYLVEFDRRCGKSNTLLRLKKHFYIKNTQIRCLIFNLRIYIVFLWQGRGFDTL